MFVQSRTVPYTTSVSTTMSVSEARAALPEILDRVQAGEEVTITRHGKPAAILVRPDTLRARRADQALAAAERLREILGDGRARWLSSRPVMSNARGEELVADLRASRSRS
jgi:antitoxin (DNA-binding transcriptional repressor) of toxin-antitoxin stability system